MKDFSDAVSGYEIGGRRVWECLGNAKAEREREK